MILWTALPLFIGNVWALSQPEAPAETEFSRNVKNVINSVNGISVNFSKLIVKDLKPEGNFIFSPLNLYDTLALVHLGAIAGTKIELSGILELPAEKDKLTEARENFGKLLDFIQNTTFNKIHVNIANGIFFQKGLKLKESYLNGAKNYYKSEAQQLDFAKGGPEATNAANKWVADQTKDRIKNLFNDELSKNTQILLASTLYFAGEWSYRFNKSDTQMKNFNTGVKQVQIPTMTNNKTIPYFNNKDLKFEAASIPYSYADFLMLIVLPHRDQPLKTLVNSLKPKHLSEIIASFKPTHVNYQIPQIKFKWTQDINEPLYKIFDKAELDNMADLKNISISRVTHVAEVEVNEEGTLASAIPKVQSPIKSTEQPNPDTPVPFHADRPFFFSIYHWASNVILFTGVVQNPANVDA